MKSFFTTENTEKDLTKAFNNSLNGYSLPFSKTDWTTQHSLSQMTLLDLSLCFLCFLCLIFGFLG